MLRKGPKFVTLNDIYPSGCHMAYAFFTTLYLFVRTKVCIHVSILDSKHLPGTNIINVAPTNGSMNPFSLRTVRKTTSLQYTPHLSVAAKALFSSLCNVLKTLAHIPNNPSS